MENADPSLTPHPPDKYWRAYLAFVFAALAGLLWIYQETALSVIALWQSSETFAHGFIIYPVSLYLIWRERAYLSSIAPRPSALALTALVVLGLGWMVAQSAGAQVVAQYNRYAAVTPAPTFSMAATQPVQFGYRQKDKLKLQYLELSGADLMTAAMKVLKPVDLLPLDSVAFAYYSANENLFQTTPATQPATQSVHPATQPASPAPNPSVAAGESSKGREKPGTQAASKPVQPPIIVRWSRKLRIVPLEGPADLPLPIRSGESVLRFVGTTSPVKLARDLNRIDCTAADYFSGDRSVMVRGSERHGPVVLRQLPDPKLDEHDMTGFG